MSDKKQLLEEALQRHKQILEYTFYIGEEGDKPEGEDVDNLLFGSDEGLTEQEEVVDDPFAGEEEPAADTTEEPAAEEDLGAMPGMEEPAGEDPFGGDVPVEDEMADEPMDRDWETV